MSHRILIRSGVAWAFAALYFGAALPAEAALTVDNGYLSGATIKGSVLYRNFNSTNPDEVYVDNSDITCSPSCTLVGASNDIGFGLGSGTRTITFEYDGATKTLKSAYSRTGVTTVTTSETYTVDLGDLNYLAFEVKNPGAAPVVNIANVVISKGATTFTPNPAISTLGATNSLAQKYAIGEDLTGGFKVTAELGITGSPSGGDSFYVLMKVGYFTPPDNQAPIVSNVHTDPGTPLLNSAVDVEGNVDDTERGGSTIDSADYKLDDSLWQAMYASDSLFDEVAEDVEVMTDVLTSVGRHTTCVRGTDSAGNVSGTDPTTNDGINPCVDFIVAYAFDGFFEPIDNVNLNIAQAGRAVPFKWRLTDANGVPIDDPASFVQLASYPIGCDDLTGSIVDSLEEYSAGSSGLQYNGDGYWQFNWKTPKTYAGTCRAAYVEFNSTQISPIVNFKFRK